MAAQTAHKTHELCEFLAEVDGKLTLRQARVYAEMLRRDPVKLSPSRVAEIIGCSYQVARLALMAIEREGFSRGGRVVVRR